MMRGALGLVAAVGLVIGGGAVAQTPPGNPTTGNPTPTMPAGAPSSPSPAAAGDLTKPQFDTTTPVYDVVGQAEKGANTVVAEVDGRAITLGDVGEEIRALPPSLNAVSFEVLYPAVLERLIRQQALVIYAQRQALDEDPAVRRRIKSVVDKTLENAALLHGTAAMITEQMVLDRYKRDIAGKPGPDEVRAWTILVPTEAEARAIIKELAGGADFSVLAHARSKDSTARVGGDLGFVRWQSLAPEISAVVFTLPPGQVAPSPIPGATGWFVMKAGDRRATPTPTLSESRESIRLSLSKEGVLAVTQQALSAVAVRAYSMNGQEVDSVPFRGGEDRGKESGK